MKIEIAEPGRMTQSGSSLLKLIQNNKTPILDLLVRESVQNSLDAHKSNVNSVTVEFLTGTFDSRKMSKELEGISLALDNKFSSNMCQYIAICDSNTVGLTGEMDVQNVKGNNYGNLLKLVYEICKPQEAEGSGGSWGLGKTVYFRIGIGLVIYYSRIDEGNGNYSSRLAASFVEDETSQDAMIPEYKGMARRGIAWWGENIRENTTVPITDENYINDFLDIFGISPYLGEKTGTIIIIPYVNNETLLANNRIDYTDVLDEHLSPYWYSSVENYLRIAVQRWYAPRLVNYHYPYGAFLKVKINGEGISADSMEPVFKTVQSLYNRANYVEDEDFFSLNAIDVTVGEANVRKFLNDTVAGNIACAKINREQLHMDIPYNKPEPAIYFNSEITDKTVNRPIVFYVRKPGMIVSYENVSNWTAGIPSTNKNEFIFGIFVLNSHNSFKNGEGPIVKLEEYVRKSEMADHTSWNDWTSSHFNPRIISKIQKSVTKVIGNQYVGDDIEQQPRENSELSKFLGDLILPPNGFGKTATVSTKRSVSGNMKKQKKFLFAVDYSDISYSSNIMTVPLELKTTANNKIRQTAFDIYIDSETGKISLDEWEDLLKLDIPFFVDKVDIFIDSIDSEKKSVLLTINKTNTFMSFENISFMLKSTKAGTFSGFSIIAKEAHSVKIKFAVSVNLVQKNVRPAFVFEKEVK